MAFAIKADIGDPTAETFVFAERKTMYGGKLIKEGDRLFLFANETGGGCRLVAEGVVTEAVAVPKKEGIARQTPRVSVVVRRMRLAVRPLGRPELKPHTEAAGRRPEAEINFKFYRQATDKIVGISAATANFLAGFF